MSHSESIVELQVAVWFLWNLTRGCNFAGECSLNLETGLPVLLSLGVSLVPVSNFVVDNVDGTLFSTLGVAPPFSHGHCVPRAMSPVRGLVSYGVSPSGANNGTCKVVRRLVYLGTNLGQ